MNKTMLNFGVLLPKIGKFFGNIIFSPLSTLIQPHNPKSKHRFQIQKTIKLSTLKKIFIKKYGFLYSMVSGVLKSRRLRRVQVKTVTGTKTHYRQRNRSIAKCAVTKKPLRGIARLTNRQFKNLNKTQKTVSRPYGGYMSHSALKEKIIKEMVLSE